MKKLRAKRGMTLIEVLVFMSLALIVIASSFKLLSQIQSNDRLHEERLAAFSFVQTEAEKIKETDYYKLGEGYDVNIWTNSSGLVGTSLTSIVETEFYKGIPANLKIVCRPSYNSDVGDYYKVDLNLIWKSKTSGGKKITQVQELRVIRTPSTR